MQQPAGLRDQRARGVSILTRPEGRVQLRDRQILRQLPYRFNPHPARGSGATVWAGSRPTTRSRFNPHPARGSGATPLPLTWSWLSSSFQSSPGPRVGCNDHEQPPPARGATFQSSPGPRVGCNGWGGERRDLDPSVSILTRPEGRVQRGGGAAQQVGSSFQSSPGPRVGCNWHTAGSGGGPGHRFNPHPARGSGATRSTL